MNVASHPVDINLLIPYHNCTSEANITTWTGDRLNKKNTRFEDFNPAITSFNKSVFKIIWNILRICENEEWLESSSKVTQALLILNRPWYHCTEINTSWPTLSKWSSHNAVLCALQCSGCDNSGKYTPLPPLSVSKRASLFGWRWKKDESV